MEVNIVFIFCLLIQSSFGASFVPGKGCGVAVEIRTLKGPLKQSMLQPCGMFVLKGGHHIEDGNDR